MKEAMFYKRLKESKVHCYLCPHYCVIGPGERGKCGVRINNDGILYSLVYEKAFTTAIDPIEKKPLFHFIPGSYSYSMATVGCNFSCLFCQNWEIASPPKAGVAILGEILRPAEIVEQALAANCKSIAYTYTEPTIFYEYAYDTARLAHEKGLKNVFISNGFITLEAIDKISPYLDAVNIDLKGFSESYYREICGGRLKPVLQAIKKYYENNIWIELTTLIVPGHMDKEEFISAIAEFIADIDTKIPWHISRFYPARKMENLPPTDFQAMEQAIQTGKNYGLKYIYAGNVYGNQYENTYCPKCGKKIIERSGFMVTSMHMNEDRCAFCGAKIDMILE